MRDFETPRRAPDWGHLQAYAKFCNALGGSPKSIVVVGAGLIGCELANDLALAGHTVTLLDVAARPLAAALQVEQSAQLLQSWSPLALTFIGGVHVTHVGRALVHDLLGKKQITTGGGQTLAADHIIVAAGLQTPSQLAQSAGLAWNNGIDVHAETLATSVAGIHALGDCIAINGQVSRYIEPIGRQAKTIVANILGRQSVPYVLTRVPLRIKTSSLPFTL